MRRHCSDSNLTTFSRPDVTPLVDLTFLLLIVFMITAPVMEYSLDIKPPDFNAEALDEKEHILVNLDKNGVIHVNKNAVSEHDLQRILIDNLSNTDSVQVFIRADESRPYGDVIN